MVSFVASYTKTTYQKYLIYKNSTFSKVSGEGERFTGLTFAQLSNQRAYSPIAQRKYSKKSQGGLTIVLTSRPEKAAAERIANVNDSRAGMLRQEP